MEADADDIENIDKMNPEEKKLAIQAMPKKRKRLYEKMIYSNKQKTSKVSKLKRKREELDGANETQEKIQKVA